MTGEDRQYHVVRNDEQQFSVWPTGRALPWGWHNIGVSGTETQCLAHIDRVWTDMRPRTQH